MVNVNCKFFRHFFIFALKKNFYLIPVYSDIHRATVQAIMTKGSFTEKEFMKIFKEIFTHYGVKEGNPRDARAEDLELTIDLINSRINRFDQKIVKYFYRNVNYYCFCSTAQTSISKMQSDFNENEVDLFKAILHKIVEDEELCTSPISIMNLHIDGGTKVNTSRVEKLLEDWVMNGYFVRENNNMIYLGPKSFIEFKEILQSFELDYLRSCILCGDIAPWGVACSACHTATYHKHCMEKFLARSDKCVACNEKWETPIE
jgi:non-structural maintenance of chromosomes element 1